MIGTILGAVLVGLIVGALARLVMPGKQNIGVIMTVLLGIVGVFPGHLDLLQTRILQPERRLQDHPVLGRYCRRRLTDRRLLRYHRAATLNSLARRGGPPRASAPCTLPASRDSPSISSERMWASMPAARAAVAAASSDCCGVAIRCVAWPRNTPSPGWGGSSSPLSSRARTAGGTSILSRSRIASASAQVVASGTVVPLAITAGSSAGTSLIVSVTTFAGQYVGALDLFWAHPGVLGAEQLASALVAAELAQMPLLDLLAKDLQAAVADPDSDS